MARTCCSTPSRRSKTLVSTFLGNTRVRERKGGPRVTAAHLNHMRAILKPGDILIERQDWFLSRALMPGYWAHAAIYMGDAETLSATGLADHEFVGVDMGRHVDIGHGALEQVGQHGSGRGPVGWDRDDL